MIAVTASTTEVVVCTTCRRADEVRDRPAAGERLLVMIRETLERAPDDRIVVRGIALRGCRLSWPAMFDEAPCRPA